MAKDPTEQSQKLEVRLKKAMIESRLVAFTHYHNENGLSSTLMFWQTAADTHLLEIDYSNYAEKGTFNAKLSIGKRGDKAGEVIAGETVFKAEFSKKSELVKLFSKWLRENFSPPHVAQVETKRLSP